MSTFEIIKIYWQSTYCIMTKGVIKEFKENYDFYKKLLEERKSIFEKVIDISERGNNASLLQKESNIQHSLFEDKLILIVNVKINNNRFFKFKLQCKSLCSTPFFRFDSDGVTHKNMGENIPLSEQQITTPHFHYFNEKGMSIAYKTDKLLNEQEQKALEDINLCIAHFCQEGNIVPVSDEYPLININSNELPLVIIVEDPLSNINF